MNKKTNVPESYKQMEAFSRNGVAVFSNFIIGFPGDTDRSACRDHHLRTEPEKIYG